MDALDQIRLHRLLKERETLFAKVFSLEKAVERTLGGPYPFPPPPPLPSLRGGGAARPSKEKRGKPFRARRLAPGEHAYLVEFARDGKECKEFHRDPRLVDLLVSGAPGGRVAVKAVSTVAFDDMDGGVRLVARLL